MERRRPDPALNNTCDAPRPGEGVVILDRHKTLMGPIAPLHWHEELQCILVTGGHMVVPCHSGPINLFPGEAVIINPGELHGIENSSSELHFHIVRIDLSAFVGDLGDVAAASYLFPIRENLLVFRNQAANDPAVVSLVRALVDARDGEALGRELVMRSLVFSLLAILVRGYLEPSPRSGHESPLFAMRRLKPAIDLIDRRFREELNLDILAAEVNMSPSWFCRYFRRLTGISSSAYILRKRLEYAKGLLETTALSVGEAAYASGFNDAAYFSRVYKRATGLNPQDVLHGARNKSN